MLDFDYVLVALSLKNLCTYKIASFLAKYFLFQWFSINFQIPTFHIEDADNVKIEVPDKLHIRNIFFQQSSNLEIMLSGSEDGHFVINEPALGNEENDQKQFVAFWNESKSDLVTENLKRSGIYPLADQKLVKNLK